MTIVFPVWTCVCVAARWH